MQLSTSRHLAAPADIVWSLQLRQEEWPQRLPNFRSVERRDRGTFGVGSSALVRQPALGSVVWTVDTFDEAPTVRRFSWTATSRGVRYVAGHEVVALPDGTSRLTLSITAEGPVVALMAPLLRRIVQRTIDAEAVAFERWADEAASPVDTSSAHRPGV